MRDNNTTVELRIVYIIYKLYYTLLAFVVYTRKVIII